MPYVQDALRSEDLLCQFWAAWAAALLSWDARAINILRTSVENKVAIPEVGLQMAVRRADPESARRWIGALLNTEGQIRSAILGLGMLGDPADVPVLFQFMEQESTARLAGAAFRMITGQDLKREYLDRPEPPKSTDDHSVRVGEVIL